MTDDDVCVCSHIKDDHEWGDCTSFHLSPYGAVDPCLCEDFREDHP